jgi:hypothetical protein
LVCHTEKKEQRLGVFENRVLRTIFGPKRNEGTADRRKLHSEDFPSFCSLLNAVGTIKSRRMKWAEHVARI